MKKQNIKYALIPLVFILLLSSIVIGKTNEALESTSSLCQELPIGSIVIWSGHYNDFNDLGYLINDTDWHLCNGAHGTTDLQHQFIVGLDAEESDYDEIGKTGGEEEVTLTINEIPSHTHSYFDNYAQFTRYMSRPPNGVEPYASTLTGAYQYTQSTGGGNAHENRPQFKVVAFIQKVA